LAKYSLTTPLTSKKSGSKRRVTCEAAPSKCVSIVKTSVESSCISRANAWAKQGLSTSSPTTDRQRRRQNSHRRRYDPHLFWYRARSISPLQRRTLTCARRDLVHAACALSTRRLVRIGRRTRHW